jgi:hypothetical protein
MPTREGQAFASAVGVANDHAATVLGVGLAADNSASLEIIDDLANRLPGDSRIGRHLTGTSSSFAEVAQDDVVTGVDLAVAGIDQRRAHLGLDGGVRVTKQDLETFIHEPNDSSLRLTIRPRRGTLAARSAELRQGRGKKDMMTILVFHEVEDVDHWLSSPKRAELFGKYNVASPRTFTDPQGSNRVGLVLEVSDPDLLRKIMDDEDLPAAMQHDGVRPETLIFLEEAGL